ncbi:MAG: FAD-dependent oxidoreductase [Acidobacteria bacterium]|nr:FAD-dependent oxidoreductase [Acidobacteriota bacterium]
MRTITRRRLAQAAAGVCAAGQLQAQRAEAAEVVVYGATPGGIASAVAAARLGRTVLLCAHEDHIGGIVSNGLTNADIGKRQAVGGLFYEFTRRVVAYYEEMDKGNPAKPNVKLCRDGYWYEANAAERIFHQMIGAEGGRIRLLLQHELRRAIVERNRLVAIEVSGGQLVRVTGQVFVDATYEGDLAAMAGAPFRTGRESRSEYGEPHAGRIYMKFRGEDLLPGSTGEADNATQAYCFRFHVTNDPAKRVPIEKPDGYRREDYHFVLEDIRSGKATKFRDIIQVYPMPNGRFELNSDHVHPDTGVPKESLDLAEECWPWPTATVAERRKIYERYRTHNVGMIWLLQNDPEVPEALRRDALQYGWHIDEWLENGHVPRQVYVRQGRRIVGDYVLTERDADFDSVMERTRVRRDSIAVIEWAFDPHGHHRYDPAHPGVREGYFFVLHEPFQVPYGVLVPRKIEGLLVPVACSCSHVAYNALRMEPVFMALGEAAGIAAHLAIARNVEVRRVPTGELQALLVERRGVITFYEDLAFTDERMAAMQWLGARGFGKGYRAGASETLIRADAAARVMRVLTHEGKRWKPPAGEGKLSEAEVGDWLRSAGYVRAQAAGAGEPLTAGALARLLYAAMRPDTT